MALQDNAWITVANAKTLLGETGGTQDALIERVVNRASDFCDQALGRPLVQATFSTLRLPAPRGCALLAPRAVPIKVASAVTITLNGTALTVWKQEADGAPEDFDVVLRALVPGSRWAPDVFWKADGWATTSSQRPDPIVLTYTGGVAQGLATIPGDLLEAFFEVLLTFKRTEQKQLAGVTGLSGAPTGSISFEGAHSLVPVSAMRALERERWVPV